MGICPLLHQQSDGHTRVDKHKALSGLAPGLITPRDLPGSKADRDIWLMSLLCLGFSWLRLWLGHLEPAGRHTYLLYDESIRHSKQGTWWVGCWEFWRGGWRHDDQHGPHTQDIVLNLLCYGHYGIAGSSWHIVH